MPRSLSLKSLALDVLTGSIALFFVILWVILYRTNDLQAFTLMTAALFFLAGVVRGRDAVQNAVLKSLLIGSGGVVPVVVMRVTGIAFTEYGYVPLFVLFSLLMAAAGAGTRRLFASGQFRWASLLALLSLGGATLAITTAIPPLVARWSSKTVNLPVPSFSLVTPDGKTANSATLRGHVVVLAFWATWCVPCREELPDLQKVYEHYKNDRNATFYAVGGPWGGDTIGKESAFASRINLTLPLAFDSDGAAQGLGVHSFPALVILDGDGHIRLIHNGYDASERLAQRVATEVAVLTGNQM
jgi:peroxiredoxin